MKISLKQVVRHRVFMIRICCAHILFMCPGVQIIILHEALDPLVVNGFIMFFVDQLRDLSASKGAS